jgi:hypothetical protein
MPRPGTVFVFSLLLCSLVASTSRAGPSLRSDERVVFFPTAAHWDGNSWVAPIHGWVFEPELASLWRNALLESLREILQIAGSASPVFEERASWFLVDNERGKKIDVGIAGVSERMAKSSADGHFRGTLRLPKQTGGRVLRIRALTPPGDLREFKGALMLVPEEGVSVISDIDDTIKITEVRDHEATLRRTFLLPFEAVPGMAALFTRWRSEGAFFHYVSASPWHLFVPLSKFMQRELFPFGTMRLRDFRIKDASAWKILSSSKEYKTAAIDRILRRYPKRHFVLVGDSGEADPEIYANLARRYPAQVRAIFIRLVRPSDMPTRRLEAAQRGLKARLQVFRNAQEVSAVLAELP